MQGARPVGRFPPSQRIRRHSEFQKAQSRGRRVRTAHFILLLYARSTDPDAPARLGLVASRKIGNAVRRNRAKRLAREAFRATRDLMQPGIDLVVIIRRDMQSMKLDDAVAEWRRAAPVIERRIREAREDLERRRGSEGSRAS